MNKFYIEWGIPHAFTFTMSYCTSSNSFHKLRTNLTTACNAKSISTICDTVISPGPCIYRQYSNSTIILLFEQQIVFTLTHHFFIIIYCFDIFEYSWINLHIFVFINVICQRIMLSSRIIHEQIMLLQFYEHFHMYFQCEFVFYI